MVNSLESTMFQAAAERYTRARIDLLKARDEQAALHARLHMAELEKGWEDKRYYGSELAMIVNLMPEMVQVNDTVRGCLIELIEAEGELIMYDKTTVQIRA